MGYATFLLQSRWQWSELARVRATRYDFVMGTRSAAKANSAKGYIIGEKGFAAISAVEGLRLAPTSGVRLKRTRALSQEQRRAETIRAFAQPRNRG